MSHECPVCGLLCHCGGDIDDMCLNDEDDVVCCTHCEEGELDEDDPEFWEEEQVSRTRKQQRPAGKEYWKSRLHRFGETIGPVTKRLTHKKERRKSKQICFDEMKGQTK